MKPGIQPIVLNEKSKGIQIVSIGKPQLENLCFDRAMVPTKVIKSDKSSVYSIKVIPCVSFKVFIDYIESFF